MAGEEVKQPAAKLLHGPQIGVLPHQVRDAFVDAVLAPQEGGAVGIWVVSDQLAEGARARRPSAASCRAATHAKRVCTIASAEVEQ